MKELRKFSGPRCLVALKFLLAALLFTGCHTPPNDISFSPVPGGPGADGSTAGANQIYTEVLRVGDLVDVKFSGGSTPPPTHEERIKEDGTLTLPEVGAVTATNRTPGDLQNELTELYSKYYKSLVVTVEHEGRHYYVGGQVRNPGLRPYVGKTTVTTAIQAAGDFTEFANKKKVWLARPGQKPVRVNVVEALKDPLKDLQVFPGDRIDVPRRWPG